MPGAKGLAEIDVFAAEQPGQQEAAKVGDGEWPVRGPDIAEGSKVRVVSAEGGVLVVEAL